VARGARQQGDGEVGVALGDAELLVRPRLLDRLAVEDEDGVVAEAEADVEEIVARRDERAGAVGVGGVRHAPEIGEEIGVVVADDPPRGHDLNLAIVALVLPVHQVDHQFGRAELEVFGRGRGAGPGHADPGGQLRLVRHPVEPRQVGQRAARQDVELVVVLDQALEAGVRRGPALRVRLPVEAVVDRVEPGDDDVLPDAPEAVVRQGRGDRRAPQVGQDEGVGHAVAHVHRRPARPGVRPPEGELVAVAEGEGVAQHQLAGPTGGAGVQRARQGVAPGRQGRHALDRQEVAILVAGEGLGGDVAALAEAGAEVAEHALGDPVVRDQRGIPEDGGRLEGFEGGGPQRLELPRPALGDLGQGELDRADLEVVLLVLGAEQYAHSVASSNRACRSA
jgi:hypothetical protein